MRNGTGRYPAYRNSGLSWLGEIPAHWETRRNGRLFAERSEAADPELPLLEVSIRTGVRVRWLGDGGRKQAMADRSKYQRARAGDIAYNMMRMWQGAVGVVPTDGLVSPAYVVARPYEDVESRYYAYLFRTAAYMQQVSIESRGIVPDRNRLYWDAFKAMPSVYPPADEQIAIVKYLVSQDKEYDRYLRLKRRIIGVLDERRTNVMRSLITHGTDGRADSSAGAEWTASVPEHWDVKRLKYVATIIYGASPHQNTYNETGQGTVLVNGPDEYSEEDFGYTRAIKWTTAPVRFAPRDALLFCLRGSTTGRLNICHDDVSIGRGVAALVPNVDPRFFLYGMMVLRQVVRDSFRGSTFPSVTSQMLGGYRFPVPPEEEQRAICVAIERAVRPLDEARASIEREIAVIGEHRARLTSEVVMGRIDVRELAASLPATRSEAEPDESIPDEDSDAEEEEELSKVGADAD